MKLVKRFFSKLERNTHPLVKIGVSFLVIGSSCYFGYNFQNKSDVPSSTVMITNMNGNSGGSGSVIHSDADSSYVLTNSHVCNVAEKGGLVKTNKGTSHTIMSYKQSKLHDLCLIKVAAQLPGKVTLSQRAPRMFEEATVSGHPSLFPNVVTKGHFSGNKIIDVFLGMRECTEKDIQDYEMICYFFGGIPMIRTYESVLVTATIMPGSSGSAIYNSNKELNAVVFAGSGELGYAFSVPFEYVNMFLNEEINTLPEQKVNYLLSVDDIFNIQSEKDEFFHKIEIKCKSDVWSITDVNSKMHIQKMCDTIIRDVNWRKGSL